jgi:nucleotide-binding universal stress UspA family protein
MKTIVALIDLTEVTSKILGLAQTLASALHSHVILLHVVPPVPLVATLGGEMPAIPEPPAPDEVEARKAQFQKLLDSLIQRGINATALQFEGPVVGTVLEETQKLNADLVIMGSHHHHAIYNFFVGSVAAELLKRLPFPVLVVPTDVPEKVDITAPKESYSAEEVRQKQAVMPPVLAA